MEQIMEEVKKKRRSNSVDRIVLSVESQALLKQLNEFVSNETQGMLQIPIRELANYVLQKQNPEFTESDIAELRARFSDDVKVYKWAWDQARKAKVQGQSVDHKSLQKIIQMQSVEGKPRALRVPRERKNKMQAASGGAAEVLSTESPMTSAAEAKEV
jgi:hypothetical protein